MKNDIRNLREQVGELESRLESKKFELDTAIRNCHHNWTDTIADHIYHPGYQCPGDPPGTMGIDWRGPVWVDARTEKRWKRTCQTCGLVEYTTRTKEEVTEHPTFE